jgi:hypothetical protein
MRRCIAHIFLFYNILAIAENIFCAGGVMKNLTMIMLLLTTVLIAVPVMGDDPWPDYPNPIMTVTTDKSCYLPGEEIRADLIYDGNHVPPAPADCLDDDCEWQTLALGIDSPEVQFVSASDDCFELSGGNPVEWGGCSAVGSDYAIFKISNTIAPGTELQVKGAGHFYVDLPEEFLQYDKFASASKTVSICESTPAPEFPSALFPAAFILGTLFIIGLISITRKQ